MGFGLGAVDSYKNTEHAQHYSDWFLNVYYIYPQGKCDKSFKILY